MILYESLKGSAVFAPFRQEKVEVGELLGEDADNSPDPADAAAKGQVGGSTVGRWAALNGRESRFSCHKLILPSLQYLSINPVLQARVEKIPRAAPRQPIFRPAKSREHTRLDAMSNEIDFDEVLGKYRSDPFDYIEVCAVHTGRVQFKVGEGSEVNGASGEWQQIPGTALYEINRERNPKIVPAQTNGTVAEIRSELDGQFVEAGERLMTIKHPLKKKEIIEGILKQVLSLFSAPETAKYFFSLEVQSRIDKKGARAVTIEPGDEIITMSLMKRDTPVYYSGEKGVIHSIYFKPGVSVRQGEPLLGICSAEKLPLIQKIITKVKADWNAE